MHGLDRGRLACDCDHVPKTKCWTSLVAVVGLKGSRCAPISLSHHLSLPQLQSSASSPENLIVVIPSHCSSPHPQDPPLGRPCKLGYRCPRGSAPLVVQYQWRVSSNNHGARTRQRTHSGALTRRPCTSGDSSGRCDQCPVICCKSGG